MNIKWIQLNSRKFILTFLSLLISSGTLDSAQRVYNKEKTKKIEWEKTQLADNDRKMLSDARSYAYLKTLDFSLRQYEELLRRYPRNPFLLKEVGDVYSLKGNFLRAKELYDQAAFLRPFDPEMRLAWVRSVESYKKDRKEAIRLLNEMIQTYPDFVDARIELANYLSWDQRWLDAIAEFDKMLLNDPENIPILFHKAQFQAWANNYPASILTLKNILAKEPDNIEALTLLGEVYMNSNKWEEAAKVFEKLYEKNPNNSEVLKSLADAYFFDERYQSAESIYNLLVQTNPQVGRTLSSRLSSIAQQSTPTIAYPFLFYSERDHQLDTKAESLYHSLEYVHPINHWLTFLASLGSRKDETIRETAFIYGMGWILRLSRKFQHTFQFHGEPNVDSIDLQPKLNFNNVLTWRVSSRWQVEGFNRTTSYWDNNFSSSQGFAINRFFLEEYNLLIGYRFIVDLIENPSPYFVTINKGGAMLNLVTNSVNIEKYWNISKTFVLTTASSYSVTDQGRNTLNIYGNFRYALTPKTSLNLGTSWSHDNEHIQTFTASSYVSQKF